jgi:hypothetical protein
MKRNHLNYIVDAGLGIAFLGVFITGIIKFPDLLRFAARIGIVFPTRLFTTIHKWSGAAMGGIVFIHLVLHWKWIVKTTKGFFREGFQRSTSSGDASEAVLKDESPEREDERDRARTAR